MSVARFEKLGDIRGLIPHYQSRPTPVCNSGLKMHRHIWCQLGVKTRRFSRFLPVQPTFSACTVNNLPIFALWHGRGRRFDPDQVHHLNLPDLTFLSESVFCRLTVNESFEPERGAA